ncbi:hypothetical protein [Methanocalculus chunghsingensis]|uniref:hypothetical protein n=1 Tax=Methanocalculus chunghsingensis TaxID=156457 RepID=UPI001B8ADC0F|nr:hypothetical protein [Methanocalculus chunghsingensis]
MVWLVPDMTSLLILIYKYIYEKRSMTMHHLIPHVYPEPGTPLFLRYTAALMPDPPVLPDIPAFIEECFEDPGKKAMIRDGE